jgi:fibronectin type 3 domain-containing protein
LGFRLGPALGQVFDAPSTIQASQGTFTDRIRIHWEDVPGVFSYRVYRSREQDPQLRVVVGTQAGTMFTDYTAKPSVRYLYWVKAEGSAGGNGDFSPSAAGFLHLSRLGAPLVEVSGSADGVRVTWDEVLGADEYAVYRSTSADTTTGRILTTGWLSSSFLDASGIAGVRYYYWVKASQELGEHPGGFSVRVQGQRILPAPLGVVASSGRTNGILITWSQQPDAKFYQVYRHDTNNTIGAQPVSAWQPQTEFIDDNATPGLAYYYWIRGAMDEAGTDGSGLSAFSSGFRGLLRPRGLAADSDQPQTVRLRWDEVEGATHYKVFRGADGDIFSAQEISDWQAANQFEDISLAPGEAYRYWVRAATSAVGTKQSTYSESAMGVRVLSPPSGLRVTAAAIDNTELEWDHVEGPRFFRIYRSTSPDTAAAIPLSDWQQELRFVDLSAAPGLRYYYWIKAATTDRGRLESAYGAAADNLLTMVPPESVRATRGTYADKVILSWNAVSPTAYYRIYRSTSDTPDLRIVAGDWQRQTIFQDDEAELGVEYHYWIKAAPTTTGQGASNFSAQSSGYLGSTAMPPPLLSGASDGDHDDRIEISWEAVVGATHYRVYRALENGPSSAQPLTSWQTISTYSDLTAQPGVVYQYWVKAATSSGGSQEGEFSKGNSGFRSLGVPRMPTVSEGNVADVVVRWTPIFGATHYRAYRSTTSSFSAALALSDWQAEQEFVDLTATPGVTYYYWIKAATGASGLNAGRNSEAVQGYRRLARPEELEVGSGDPEKVSIVWESQVGAGIYRVYRSASTDSSTATALGDWQVSSIFQDDTAVYGQTYHYWIRAATDATQDRVSPLSSAVSGYRGVPATDGLVSSRGNLEHVQVQWDPISGADSYRLYRADTADSALAAPVTDWIGELAFADTTSQGGKTYFYWVRAAAGDRLGPLSSMATGFRGLAVVDQAEVVPGRPDKIGLTWPAISGASHFQIYRGTSPDSTKATAISDWLVDRQFDDDTAQPGVDYYYWIRSAIDDEGSNPSSLGPAYAGFRGLDRTGVVQASAGALENIQLTWDVVTGADRYKVYRSAINDSSSAEALTSWRSSTSFTDDSAAPGINYYYWVRAPTDHTGERVGSLSTAEVGHRGVAQPAGILASTGNADSITLAWDPVEGGSFYRVYRNHTDDASTAIAISSWQLSTVFVDLAADPGQSLFYWVRAAGNQVGEHASDVSAVTKGHQGLSSPANVVAGAGSLDQIELSWDPVDGATRYLIVRGTSLNPTLAVELGAWQSGTDFVDASAVPGVSYHYWIRAAVEGSTANTSSLSEFASGHRGLQPPSALLATTGEPDSVALSWAAVSGASFYRVLRSTVEDASNAQVLGSGWQANLFAADLTTLSGANYYYWVQAATDSAGTFTSQTSAVTRGYGSMLAPADLRIVSGQGDISLEWQPNAEFDIVRYRIYAGTAPDSTALIDSVDAGLNSTALISSTLAVPGQFNLVDMGSSIFDTKPQVSARFAELVGREPTDAEVDKLFGGQRLARSDVAPLNDDLTYYFRIAAVNAAFRESPHQAGNVVSINGAEIVTRSGSPSDVLVDWEPVWGATHYRIWRHTADSSSAAATLGDWQSTTSFSDSSAAPGVEYFYWIQSARGALGEDAGDLSPATSGYKGLTPPAVVAASSDLPDRVTLNWHLPQGASYFRVYHNTKNDTLGAAAVTGWLNSSTHQHAGAAPGLNYYWVRSATDVDGSRPSSLSAPSMGERSAPLQLAANLSATWGVSRDMILVTWEAEPAATYNRLYRHTTADSALAVPVSEWIVGVGFEDKTAASGTEYYYWVRSATTETGAHASSLSIAISGLRSADVLTPANLQAAPGQGEVILSWSATTDTDLLRYRIFGGLEPASLALLDSIDASTDPAVTVHNLLALPKEFNIVDMGLSIFDSKNTISARFAELVGRNPTQNELDDLFGGSKLRKSDLASLETGRTYYFKVAAVNGSLQESVYTLPVAATVTEAAGKRLAESQSFETRLMANSPNPFNASTLIRFELGKTSQVRLAIHNALGQRVRTIQAGSLNRGRHHIQWDSRDDAGREMATGLYLYQLFIEQRSFKSRMILVR